MTYRMARSSSPKFPRQSWLPSVCNVSKPAPPSTTECRIVAVSPDCKEAHHLHVCKVTKQSGPEYHLHWKEAETSWREVSQYFYPAVNVRVTAGMSDRKLEDESRIEVVWVGWQVWSDFGFGSLSTHSKAAVILFMLSLTLVFWRNFLWINE